MKKSLFLVFLVFVCFQSKAQKIVPVSEAQLFNAFKQDLVAFDGYWAQFGGGGNCASIALIKAAIGTFGINGVFQSVTIDSTKKRVRVLLRDNQVVNINFARLKHGKSRFFIRKIGNDKISQDIAEYARFCFTVMCRQKQLNRGNDSKYWYRAVDDLNKGEGANNIYKLLGLQKDQIKDSSFANLKKYKNLVLWNAPHAVYSSSGNYDEFFRGTTTGVEPLEKLKNFHCRNCPIIGAYILK